MLVTYANEIMSVPKCIITAAACFLGKNLTIMILKLVAAFFEVLALRWRRP
jgi:hypothetical protein